ncbi:MAG: peptide ABC transporter permease [Zetaproteobacteria bacterium]|nr:peptide ABC transporter permease [Pseudobdellovibrionaceae bacterium]|tara:strand:- start:1090 stop:1917 length:828 start_codon:yes stop_codon:yes gene_type:complete
MKEIQLNKKKVAMPFTILLVLSVLIFFIFIALFAPLINSYDPHAVDLSLRLCSLSYEHPFGCDLYGGDFFSQIIQGTRTSLYIATCTVIGTISIGLILGTLAGYFKGIVDQVILHIMEIFMAFPGILLAMSIAALLGNGLNNIILALVISGWTAPARIVRGEILKIREYEYIAAARSLGMTDLRIIWKHILPNVWSHLIINASFAFSSSILVESSLSFLGFGSQQNPSWGSLINQGRTVLAEAPHLSIIPGLLIFTLVLILNYLGDYLRERFNTH